MSEAPGPPPRPYLVAVIGGSRASPEERELAERLGAALARLNAVVVCGGRGGVMEAAARGAALAGGVTVGILPGADATEANEWITVPLPTGIGEMRNALVVRACEAVVAVGGAWGTLSEIALARTMGVDVGTLGTPPADGLALPALPDPERAASWAVENARKRRGERPRSE